MNASTNTPSSTGATDRLINLGSLPKLSAYQVLGILVGIGILAIIAYGLNDSKIFWIILGVGVITAGACGMIGFVVGFLFGIPRTLQGDQATTPTGSTIRANTNLEQISDWLTKILVGVGLTQLASIPSALNDFSLFVAQGLGNGSGSQAAALAIILHFATCGFMYGFLWARLRLASAFGDADQLVQQLEEARADAKALDLSEKQLSTNVSRKPSDAELLEAFCNASDRLREFVFYRAYKIRRENWVDNKSMMAFTIPIFKALAANDKNNSNHEYLGNLGFALKDKYHPDWAEAERVLTQAINIRGEGETNGWAIYEFNRAVCRIKQDQDFEKDQPIKDQEKKSAIIDDLYLATQEGGLVADLVKQTKIINEWRNINKVAEQSSQSIETVVVGTNT